MINGYKILSKNLPKSEYNKIENIYDFIYNIYIFIYMTDPILLNETNLLCNYLIHKQLDKDVMYNKLCYGLTDIIYESNLKVYYLNIAGVNILLENVILDKKIKKTMIYNIIEIFNNECDIHYLLNQDYNNEFKENDKESDKEKNKESDKENDKENDKEKNKEKNKESDKENDKENIKINNINQYFKILFYIDLFNKDHISSTIIYDLKKELNKKLKKLKKKLNKENKQELKSN
jgi:hypothetical protein